jgi:hypothetical protein
MAIAAGVVEHASVLALAALFDVPAQDRRAAGLDGAHDAERLQRHRMSLPVAWAVTSKDIGQLESRPLHGRLLSLGLPFGLPFWLA